MLELVFVIVVAGILAAAILPRINRDTLFEASEQLLRDIKYTQHLAMMDDVYDDSDTDWFENRWRITFDDTNDQYAISKGITTNGDYARDPLTKMQINGLVGDNDYDLDDKYSITVSIENAESAGATGTYNKLAFDHLGRPYVFSTNEQSSPTSSLLTSDYNLTLSDGSGTAIISVKPETGYATVTYN